MPETETVDEVKIKPSLNTELRARFKDGRKRAGKSYEAVGKAAGVSLQSISQFEKGLQRLDIEAFAAACEFLRLDVRWVLFGRGEMFDGPTPIPKKGRPAKRTA